MKPRKEKLGGKNAIINSAEPPGPREQGRGRSFVPTRALPSLRTARLAPPCACVLATIRRSGPGEGGSRTCALASTEGRTRSRGGWRGTWRARAPLGKAGQGRRGGSDAEGGAVRVARELCGAGRCRGGGGGGGGGGGWGLTRPGSWGPACLFIYF